MEFTARHDPRAVARCAIGVSVALDMVAVLLVVALLEPRPAGSLRPSPSPRRSSRGSDQDTVAEPTAHVLHW
ncbi:hypothetical protein [Acrocarpospora macrocephala]|nr:hypothetical protein [Acrocarpospora macrocephala]